MLDNQIIEQKLENTISSFKDSKSYYLQYQKNGRLFRYAVGLKNANAKLYDSLISLSGYAPPDIQIEINKVLEHIKIWSNLWNAHQKVAFPENNDVFVFANDNIFPHRSEQIILKYCNAALDLIKKERFKIIIS